MLRSLFSIIPSQHQTGGSTILLELVRHLRLEGQEVDIFIYADSAGSPDAWWQKLDPPAVIGTDIEPLLETTKYNFVFFSHAMFLPLLLPCLSRLQKTVIPVYLTQDYESFWTGRTYEESVEECAPYGNILRIPVPIIVTSRGLQELFRARLARETLWLPVALCKNIPAVSAYRRVSQRKRILMIGNYLLPFKGMKDGFDAIQLLSCQMPVELILITRETRGRAILRDYTFPIEICQSPSDEELADIFANSDLYCCSSWYEGFGLPALEAFTHGLPVVSTRHAGVADYGIDRENILLAQPNNPKDLCNKMQEVLLDDELAGHLSGNGCSVAEEYSWSRTLNEFVRCQRALLDSNFSLPQVDENVCAELLVDLESAGLFVPSSIDLSCRQMDKTFTEMIGALARGEAPTRYTSIMEGLLKTLRLYTQNPRTAYYDVVKSRYYLCELLMSLWEDSRLVHVAKQLNAENVLHESTSASSFSRPAHYDAQ